MLEGYSGAELAAMYEESEEFNPLNYTPPGAIAERFILDDRKTPFIMGPVGGGKTTACVFKRIRAATMMPPCRDGIRRCRWVVLRSTFRDAEKTVLASWKQWFDKGFPQSTWTGGNDRPAVHTLRFLMQDGTKVEAITEFIGLNGERVEAKLRGWEISGAWMNEADTMDEEALRFLEQRVGRYPAKVMMPEGSRRYRQVVGDLNAPDIDNWVYKVFVEGKSTDRFLHSQPSGVSEHAENLKNLEPDYYQSIMNNQEDWYVRRFVHNQFGYSREGLPVYEQFNPDLHVAKIDPNQDLPLLIGMDAGLTPSAIFLQPQADGQLRVTDELIPGHGYGAQRFAEMVNELIARRYPNVRDIRAWCDPAAQYGADREGGELAWIETVSLALGIPVLVPANGSNEIGLRLDAVKAELNQIIQGSPPRARLLVGEHCTMLIRGFISKYRYKKRKNGSSEYDPQPEKNEYSHPHDALQYGVLGYRGRQAITQGNGRGWAASRSSGGWSSQSKGGFSRRSGFDPHSIS